MPGTNFPVERQDPLHIPAHVDHGEHTTRPSPVRAGHMATSDTHTVLNGAEPVADTASGHGVVEAAHGAQDRRTHHARPPLTRRLLNAMTDYPEWVWIKWTAAAVRCAWAQVLPIAGPIFLASVSAALGFFVGVLFTLGGG